MSDKKFIKSLDIHQYKCFNPKENTTSKESVLVDFAIPNGKTGSGLTIIIGPNNSGKSSIIEILEKFRYHTSLTKFELSADLEFTDKSEKISMRTLGRDLKYATIKVKESLKEYTQDQLDELESQKWRFLNTDIDFLPNIIESKRQFAEQPSYHGERPRLKDKINLSFYCDKNNQINEEVLAMINRITGEDIRLSGCFEEGLGNPNSVIYPGSFYNILELNSPLGGLSVPLSGEVEFEHDFRELNRVDHRIKYCGTGIQKIMDIAFAIATLGRSDAIKEKRDVLIIDEPELSLHPQYVKNITRILAEKAKDYQIVICTHSPHFINHEWLKNGAKIHRVYKEPHDLHNVDQRAKVGTLHYREESKENKISSAYNIKDLVKSFESETSAYQFDILAKESFFARKVLLTEGQDDVYFLRSFIEKNDIKINYEIFGYGVRGARSMMKYSKMLTVIGIKCKFLLDNDSPNNPEKPTENARKELIDTYMRDIEFNRDIEHYKINELNKEKAREELINRYINDEERTIYTKHFDIEYDIELLPNGATDIRGKEDRVCKTCEKGLFNKKKKGEENGSKQYGGYIITEENAKELREILEGFNNDVFGLLDQQNILFGKVAKLP